MKSSYTERFLAKIKIAETGCWEWTGSRHKCGYGKVRNQANTRVLLAHRASYELFVSPIPDGLCVLHKCNNKICVNPSHLYAGDLKDNYEDMRRAGTATIGERQAMAKLTNELVIQIRRLRAEGLSSTVIANRLQMPRSRVEGVLFRGKWSHVQLQ